MNPDKQDIQLILQQVSDVLLMKGGFLSNPGLYSGEMGLVLFFARYARYTQNNVYLEHSYGLMDKLQSRIHRDSPINYKEGLSGIGSTIEYLVQNGFFEADTDEVLQDFDKRIFFTYNMPYLPINNIIDIGYYATWRMSGNSSKKDFIRQTVLPQIEKVVHDYFGTTQWFQLYRKTKPKILTEKTYGHCLELIAQNNFWGKDMGLQNGLAGWGMSLLTELNDDDSWTSLLPDDFYNSKDESISV